MSLPSKRMLSAADLAERNRQMIADWTAGMRQVELAEKYGVSQGTVSKVCGRIGSPREVREEIRRLRKAVGDYFIDRENTQAERDRALWLALTGGEGGA